jgi:hypothetical protein
MLVFVYDEGEQPFLPMHKHPKEKIVAVIATSKKVLCGLLA